VKTSRCLALSLCSVADSEEQASFNNGLVSFFTVVNVNVSPVEWQLINPWTEVPKEDFFVLACYAADLLTIDMRSPVQTSRLFQS
jgi:hypothetical protein